jgi:hypothetical protein
MLFDEEPLAIGKFKYVVASYCIAKLLVKRVAPPTVPPLKVLGIGKFKYVVLYL